MHSPHGFIKSCLYIFVSDFKIFIVNYKTQNECLFSYKKNHNTLVTAIQIKKQNLGTYPESPPWTLAHPQALPFPPK